MAGTQHGQLAEQILQVVRSEFPDKAAAITMDAALRDVDINSVDLITLLFRLEDEYKAVIDFDLQTDPQTIGDLIDFVARFIGETRSRSADKGRIAAL